MTTIAASLDMRMMAADSRVTVVGPKGFAIPSTKLLRIRDFIVGCAGDYEDIESFLRWLPDQRKKRKKEKELSALVLYRNKLFWFTENSEPMFVKSGYMAVGSGGTFALAAMTHMKKTGLPIDPRVAVDVACEHDNNSAPPIDFLTWKQS